MLLYILVVLNTINCDLSIHLFASRTNLEKGKEKYEMNRDVKSLSAKTSRDF